MLTMEGGDSHFLVGAALRVDFNLGRSFVLGPSLRRHRGLDRRPHGELPLREVLAGAGALAVGDLEGGGSGSWGTVALLKAASGPRPEIGHRRLGFVGDLSWGLGLTAAYILILPSGAARSTGRFSLIRP